MTMTAPAPASLADETDLRPHDVQRLRAVAEAADLRPHQLAEQVCAHVLNHPTVAGRLAGRPDADALQRRLHRYIRSLWAGDHDRRLRNAQASFPSGPPTGISLEAYLGGFILIDDVIEGALIDALHDDPDTLRLALRSYRRVSKTDLLVHLGRSDAARGVTPR